MDHDEIVRFSVFATSCVSLPAFVLVMLGRMRRRLALQAATRR